MIEYVNRTLIATVVFVDIVGYSKHAVSEQMAVKKRFNEMVGETLVDVAESERILLDTGDGAALCFLGDPEHALFTANALRDATRNADGSFVFTLRIGVNLGPIKLIKDINGQPNVIGDAINAAQRIMSFAEPQQILVSRSFYELVSCLKPEYGQLFHYFGIRQDKHVREHELYSIDFAPTADQPHAHGDETMHHARAAEFPPPVLAQLGDALVTYMGPIARVLVKKVSRESQKLEQLCQRLAENIPVEVQKSAFLREAARLCHLPRGPAAEERPTQQQALGAEQVVAVEQKLAVYIGPLAKVLVRRARDDCGSLDDLCGAVAQHIENDRDREAFLAAFQQTIGKK